MTCKCLGIVVFGVVLIVACVHRVMEHWGGENISGAVSVYVHICSYWEMCVSALWWAHTCPSVGMKKLELLLVPTSTLLSVTWTRVLLRTFNLFHLSSHTPI